MQDECLPNLVKKINLKFGAEKAIVTRRASNIFREVVSFCMAMDIEPLNIEPVRDGHFIVWEIVYHDPNNGQTTKRFTGTKNLR